MVMAMVYLQFGGKAMEGTSNVIPPGGYRGEPIFESADRGKVACTLANKVYDIAFDADVIDGTNKVRVLEINVFLNDCPDPPAGGTSECVGIDIYLADDADGTATGALSSSALKIASLSMMAPARVRIPLFGEWSTEKIKFACTSAAATINWDAVVCYFTPKA